MRLKTRGDAERGLRLNADTGTDETVEGPDGDDGHRRNETDLLPRIAEHIWCELSF